MICGSIWYIVSSIVHWILDRLTTAGNQVNVRFFITEKREGMEVVPPEELELKPLRPKWITLQ